MEEDRQPQLPFWSRMAPPPPHPPPLPPTLLILPCPQGSETFWSPYSLILLTTLLGRKGKG